MGVDAAAFTLLAGLSKAGLLKGQILTLGRQNTFLKRAEIRSVNRAFSLNFSRTLCERIAEDRFAEGLFTSLGAISCDSVDASDYEEASYVEDLNGSFSRALAEKYDFVYDGGTTEHVYDIPQTQKNIAFVLKDGGYYCAACPTNCSPGHGFYQFSPEFYFRSLQACGFEIVRLYLSASQSPQQWYRVQDPRDVGGRITFLSAEPIYTFVVAKKSRVINTSGPPMQSDYEMGNWRTKQDHLTWDRSFPARARRLLRRVVVLRGLWALNVILRNVFLVGSAVWATSEGIRRIDIVNDLAGVNSPI